MSTLFDLNLDIKLVILNYLDNIALAQLGQTCSYFANLVKSVMSFTKADVKSIHHLIPKSLSLLNYRAGVTIGSTFYMPFINEHPLCYTYDLINGSWSAHPLYLIDLPNLQPQITSATVIQSKIYLVCGRLLNSYTLSNAILEIDTDNFHTRLIDDMKGRPPRPRHEHSVDAVGQRYLVVFGGLCYNSVGENDVFVYDTQDNRWFVPPISGHVPHLRFGHASSVIGTSIYIHGGAQLENDSSYIVYDDLYKLDCQTWTWYKFEHPEVERYLRINPSFKHSPKNHLITTYGHSPPDRFQSYMCSHGNKLVIFGGHSIREDEQDNEILFSYSLDEISVFNTRRCTWSVLHASTNEDDETLTVSDMSATLLYINPIHSRIFIIAARKPAEVHRWKRQASHSSSSSQQDYLPRILETYNSDDSNHEEDEETVNNLEINDGENSDGTRDGHNGAGNLQGKNDGRGPNNSEHSEQVRKLFKTLDNDLEDDHRTKTKRRRPSISVIPHHEESTNTSKRGSTSSHSSGSNDSLGKRKSRHQSQATPCAISIDLLE